MCARAHTTTHTHTRSLALMCVLLVLLVTQRQYEPSFILPAWCPLGKHTLVLSGLLYEERTCIQCGLRSFAGAFSSSFLAMLIAC